MKSAGLKGVASSVAAAMLLTAASACCPAVLGATPSNTASAPPFGTDLHGTPLQRLASPDTRAVVLFFAATDCPISNRYLPEIAHLAETYRAQGVAVLSIYPNPGDTRSVVVAHEQQFGPTAETVLDPQQSLVHLAHARMTPEAAVLVPNSAGGWREVYLGRIDDRYLSLGKERPAATRQDLEEAIRAVLKHQPVPPPAGPAVGCAIMPAQP